MEPIGAFPDSELWDTFGRSIFSIDEIEFTLQNLGELQALNFGSQEDNMSICMAAGVDENFLYSLESLNSANLQYFSQENSVFLSTPIPENYCLSDSNNHTPATNDGSTDGIVNSNDGFGGLDVGQQPSIVAPAKELQLRRKFDVPAEVPTAASGGKINGNSSKNSKKIPRVSSEVQKNKKKQKHTAKGIDEDESNINGGSGTQSSTSYCSEEENGSQEYCVETSNSKSSAAALNSSGKTRASRGSATDPQSLYARKRREKINERLRILQNLVPNGTKVDISTMLEEAVHYVKFLQLQIKLLSSDEMWMYAPIAYNGMDISRKISTAL